MRMLMLVLTMLPTLALASALPDLAFAVFGDFVEPLGVFTVEQNGDSTDTPVRLFDEGDGFSVAYGWANFGAGIARGEIVNLIEILDAGETVVDSSDVFDDVELEQYRGCATVNTTYSWEDLPAGAYCARVTLDVTDMIEEDDEDDNEAAFWFAIRDPVTLNAALDNDVLTFASGSAAGWFGTKGLGADGVDAAQSLHLGHSSTNTLSTIVSGAGTLSFKWKVSSEPWYDWLRFVVDGVEKTAISGPSGDWETYSCDLTDGGTHVLEWRYTKDDSDSRGGDCGWVDQVVWTPSTQLILDAPENFSASTDDPTGVRLSWDAVPGAESYLIIRMRSDLLFDMDYVYFETEECSYFDSTAESGVGYDYTIMAYAEGMSEDADVRTASAYGIRPFPPPSLTSVSITGPASVIGGETATYSCQATYSDGATRTMTPAWTISVGSDIASISASGLLATRKVTGTRSVTIRAELEDQSATKIISVEPEVIPDFEIANGVLLRYTGVGGAVEVPPEVTSIGKEAFSGCSTLTSVTIPLSVTNVGDRAFYGCDELTSVVIRGPVKRLVGTFWDCSKLANVVLNRELVEIGNDTFDGCRSLSFIEIPTQVKILGDRAFEHCPLVEVTIPDSVETIGFYCFGQCHDLETVRLGNSVATIGASAFRETKLGEIVLPVSVSSLGTVGAYPHGSFYGCSCLTSVVFRGNAPASVSPTLYYRAPAALTTYVPFGSTGWDGLAQSATLPDAWPVNAAAEDARAIRVLAQSTVLVSLSISGPSELTSGAMATCVCTGTYADGASREVTPSWSISSGAEFATIDAAGVLWAETVTSPQEVTVTAVLGGKAATVKVKILPSEGESSFFGPFGSAVAINPGVPTILSDVHFTVYGKPLAVGDCVALYAGTELYSVARVEDETSTVLMMLFANAGKTMHFRIWNSASGTVTPEIFDADAVCDFVSPTQGDEIEGMEIVVTGTAPTYEVVYDLAGKGARTGGGGLRQSVVFGESAEDPVVSATSGYAFRGWDYTKRTDIRRSVTFTAQFERLDAGTESMTLSIPRAGWHEVSFAVLPANGSPEEVFAAVEDKIGYVTYGSANWSPTSGGTLTALEVGKGYWVQTTAEGVTWTVTGRGNPDVEIALQPGWNLIGYSLLEEGEIETVLATALATGKIGFICSGSRVYPGTLAMLTPGKGYWVYANAAVTIRFDAP